MTARFLPFLLLAFLFQQPGQALDIEEIERLKKLGFTHEQIVSMMKGDESASSANIRVYKISEVDDQRQSERINDSSASKFNKCTKARLSPKTL